MRIRAGYRHPEWPKKKQPIPDINSWFLSQPTSGHNSWFISYDQPIPGHNSWFLSYNQPTSGHNSWFISYDQPPRGQLGSSHSLSKYHMEWYSQFESDKGHPSKKRARGYSLLLFWLNATIPMPVDALCRMKSPFMSLVTYSVGAARIWSPLIIPPTHPDEIISHT